MQKIPTLFLRDTENMALVTREVNPEAAWVLAGEGTPTIKRDGTNVRIDVQGEWIRAATEAKKQFVMTRVVVWKRRNPTREEKEAGAEPGYVLASRDEPSDKHIFAAVDAEDAATHFRGWPEGQWPCEALGPKIQGGVESDVPCLYTFSWKPIYLGLNPRNFDYIKETLRDLDIEGIVWHHPDGRAAKVKRRDFGFAWPIKG